MDSKIRKHIEQHPLFANETTLNSEYMQSLKLRHYAKDTVIYRPGDNAKNAYLIVSGSIKFELATSGGQNIFVDIINKGFIFGELVLLTGFNYQSIAITNEDTDMIVIPKETLLSLIAHNAEFAIKFTKQLATNFFFFQALSAEREASNLKTKLANIILSTGLRFGIQKDKTVIISITHNELSEMLNASRQRVNIQLNEWQKAGLIECQYGTITINNIDLFSEHSGLVNGIFNVKNTAPYSQK
jgi:CRP-like cAMP-binding protein